jgi:predicted lipid-binding transport protein (Tim44 family)
VKKFLTVLLLSCAVSVALVPLAEAKRLGGGASFGKQRASPAMREAPREAPKATPTPAPAAAPSAAAAPAAAAQPKPSFMSRWGGVIAGVGAGALLGSLLGGHLGGLGAGLGGLINILLIVGILYLAYRFIASRWRAAPGGAPMQFAGAGGPSFDMSARREEPVLRAPQTVVAPGINVPPGFEIEPFVRQAQSSFLRLQAANDDRDLADLRETTTPEVFAELAMQIRERGDVPQKTDVVTPDARLLEVVVEGDQMIASLRYSGLIRETAGAPATPFDEVWHLRRAMQPANEPWLIAGIQQMA